MKRRRIRHLGLWLASTYLLLAVVAAVLPQEKLGMPAVIFSMAVAELSWPWTIVFRKLGVVTPATLFVLWFVFTPVWFWSIGYAVSLIATRLSPPREEKAS